MFKLVLKNSDELNNVYERCLLFLERNMLLPLKPAEMSLDEWAEKGFNEAIKSHLTKQEAVKGEKNKILQPAELFIMIPLKLSQELLKWVNVPLRAESLMQNRHNRRMAAKVERQINNKNISRPKRDRLDVALRKNIMFDGSLGLPMIAQGLSGGD